MLCSKCGNTSQEQSDFCPKCGGKMNVGAADDTAPATPEKRDAPKKPKNSLIAWFLDSKFLVPVIWVMVMGLGITVGGTVGTMLLWATVVLQLVRVVLRIKFKATGLFSDVVLAIFMIILAAALPGMLNDGGQQQGQGQQTQPGDTSATTARDDTSLAGVWISDTTFHTYSFMPNGEGSRGDVDGAAAIDLFTWRVEGSRLTMTFEAHEESYDIEIRGDSLTFSNGTIPGVFAYTRIVDTGSPVQQPAGTVGNRIMIGETLHYDDGSSTLDVTLEYVEFVDRFVTIWGELATEHIPDDGHVFLNAVLTIRNTGTRAGTLLTAWTNVVYDGTFEFRNNRISGNFDLNPLTDPETVAVGIMVPNRVAESDGSLVINFDCMTGENFISFVIRPGTGTPVTQTPPQAEENQGATVDPSTAFSEMDIIGAWIDVDGSIGELIFYFGGFADFYIFGFDFPSHFTWRIENNRVEVEGIEEIVFIGRDASTGNITAHWIAGTTTEFYRTER